MQRRGWGRDTRVVVREVEPAKLLHGFRDQPLDFGLFGHVGANEARFAFGLLDGADRLVAARRVQVRHDHSRA